MRYSSDQGAVEGAYLEMGVCTGITINFITALNPERTIYGFDSFEGLPSAWEGRSDLQIPKGVFAFKNKDFVPPVLHSIGESFVVIEINGHSWIQQVRKSFIYGNYHGRRLGATP